MVQVIYATKTGNTKKLAEAVARGAGVFAAPVDKAGAIQNADILFVGASLYAGGIDGKLRAFLAALPKNEVRRVAVFGSAMQDNSARNEIGNVLAAQGIPVLEKEFFCNGSFLFFHKNRPNEQDLLNAEAFARELLASASGE